jgi:hypothetical protein
MGFYSIGGRNGGSESDDLVFTKKVEKIERVVSYQEKVLPGSNDAR